jgi:phospholipase C
MLIITFDEHGGFYDHVPPPVTVATGDDSTYANMANGFDFARLGVRVPGIVASAYTAKGTVIGADANDASTIFDHTSVLATVEKYFKLKPLTQRDGAANTLEVALNTATARTSAADALTTLPDPAPDSAAAVAPDTSEIFAADPQAPLSVNQKTMAALALACDKAITPPNLHAALNSNYQKLVEQKDAADYIQSVDRKIRARRKPRAK